MRELNEARLIDISLPVGTIAYDLSQLDDVSQQGTETFGWYETSFSDEMLRDFYQKEMERLGWKEVKIFASLEETILVYENPRKVALISIRPLAGKRSVTFFLGLKNQYSC